MTSIRRFLVVVLLATMTLVNFLAALHGYRTSMAEAETLFDAQLADIAGVLETTSASVATPDRTAHDDAGIVFQVWRGGLLQAASDGAPAVPLAAFEPGYSDVNFGGYRWRALSRYVGNTDSWLLVAQRADVRFTLAESVIVESVLPIVLSLPLAGLLIWLIVGRGLRPLRDLAAEMGAKRSDDLTPVSSESPPAELEVLVDSINGLLARLDASFERERRFAADAAHELRTPVSIIKVQLHNLLRAADDDEAAKLAPLRDAVERMGHSVEQVLTLYRTSPDQFVSRFAELDLASIARDVIAEQYPRLRDRGQQIELEGGPARLHGDEFALRQLLVNLVDNAGKYAGAEARIRVSVAAAGGTVRLVVEDSGPGIPPAERERVFRRFYRGRGPGGETRVSGSGVGLAIVRHIVEIHGAEIRLGESTIGGGLAVEVDFPVAGLSPGERPS